MPNREFVYTLLNELTPRPFAYIFGVVIHSERYKASDGEITQRILLTDHSLDFFDYRTFIIKYSLGRFPPILIKYDIVRLRRVTINRNVTTPNELCGYAQIDSGGFDISIWKSEHPPNSNLGFDVDDLCHVDRLKSWCSIQRRKFETIKDSSPTISSFSFGCYLTVVVQIIAVGLLNDCLVLRVWDGTKAFCSLAKLEFDQKLTVLLSKNEFLEVVAKDFAVDVIIYDDHVEKAKSLKSGYFVKLKNVHAFALKGKSLANLVLHGGGSKYERGIEVISVSNDLPICLRLKNRIISDYPIHLLPKCFN